MEAALQSSPRCWPLKYALEWLAGGLGLVLILPLLLLLAFLVKVTSPGPVFFITERLGRNGQVFRLFKFRSMKVGVAPVLGPDGKVLTLAKDPRCTPIGGFLRLGFDELPQLINVLRGEMCLIGPRPDVPAELERYTSRERLRLQALPGITGLTQVVGGREMNNAQNYELDARYVERSSLWMDVQILLLTLPYSFGATRMGRRVFQREMEGVEGGDVEGREQKAKNGE